MYFFYRKGDVMRYLPRIVDKEIDELMEIMGAVLIEGCKWCGKSTTGAHHAKV